MSFAVAFMLLFECLCLLCVSVCLGCHSKIPQAGQLRRQKFIFSQFCRLEVQDHGAIRVSGEASLPGL